MVSTVLLLAAFSLSFFYLFALSSLSLLSIFLISYPLYLWHCSLFAFARILIVGISAGARVSLLAASVALAALTFAVIELSLRFVSLFS